MLAVVVAFQVYALVNPLSDTPRVQLSSNNPKTDDTLPQSTLSRIEPAKLNKIIETVTQRNIFKVEVNGEHKKEPEPVNLNLEKTSLELTLWGTVTGQKQQDSWAVINDIKTKQQELYRINDQIQGATIKDILRNKVVLTVNGKDQILEMNTDSRPSQPRSKRVSSDKRPTPLHHTTNPEQPNLPDKEAQSDQLFKTRPYVRNGESSGVMIYSIKKDSVAQLLGLRNGDIIQAVDDVEVHDVQDLENLGNTLGDQSDVTISILRRGKPKELVFNGQDNAYTVNDVEQ